MSITHHFFHDTLPPPYLPLNGLRVAVTGGTAGLGLALVDAFVAHGARVAFLARGGDDVDLVQRRYPTAVGLVADISRKDDIYPAALQILGALGGLDVLVNNASSLGPSRLQPLADTDCEDFERALATNLIGPFRLTKALLGALAASARDGGHPTVVNISSDAAINAYPTWGAYSASKAALHHLTRIWDEEMRANGVRVVSFDPGDMNTALHAQALPDADRSTLKRPETAAAELLQLVAAQSIAA